MKKIYLFIFTLLIVAFANAQTNVSGGIYSNTTWTLANSPYIVVDTVVVFPGVTLTIQPGVVVKFANNKRLEVRSATLMAVGTVTDSIIFTSSSNTPFPGIWNSIYLFNNTTTPSSFDYCKIEYSDWGICFSSDAAAHSISNSVFVNNTDAIWGSATLFTSFVNCDFKYNTTAIGITDGGRFNNCNISYNQNGGSVELATFRSCTIHNNVAIGIELNQGDSLINCDIKYNGTGVRTACMSPCVIIQNVIENNNLGVELGIFSGPDYIYCNRFCGNTTYDVKYWTTANTNEIAHNYWCTLDSDTISMHIYDGYDDASYGLLTFEPIDSTQCYLTGCGLTISANVTNATCDTCHTGSATAIISNGFAPYSYTWYTSPIQYTQTATGLASGTYTVCITDSHGCTACNYNIFVDSTNCTGFAVHASATNATCSLCNDGTATATITAGTPPYYYTWYTSPIQTTQIATGLAAGSYAVCVYDLYGCTACDTATVGVGSCSAYYTIAANGNPHTYDLTNLASGTPPLTYDWNWGDGSPHDTAAFPSHTYSGAGNYTICLSITDSAGCTNNYCHTFYLLSPMSTAVTVNVIPPVQTAVHTNEMEKTFSVHPNPTSSSLIIESSASNPIQQIQLHSIEGALLKSILSPQSSVVNLDLYELSSGIYILDCMGAKGREMIKVVKY